MSPRHERGASLILAIFVLFIVTLSCLLVADGLTRRTRIARHQLEIAAREDLARAGRAIWRARSRQAAWQGPETFELAGGTVTVSRVSPGAGELLVVPRISGREMRESVGNR